MTKKQKKMMNFDELSKITKPIKLKKIYILPVFSEGFTDSEIDKISMESFLFPGGRNRDRYFSERVNHTKCEEINKIYLTKEQLDKDKFEYIDFIPEIEIYIFSEKNG